MNANRFSSRTLPAGASFLTLLIVGLAQAPITSGAPAQAPPAGSAGPDQPEMVIELSPMRLVFKPARSEIEILHRNRSLLVYAMSPLQLKPYVKELRTLNGDNLLLDSPPDHVHHHGLMYAITVNGTNFWEEQTDPGVQLPSPVPSREIGLAPDGRPVASFSHSVFWLPRTNRTAGNPAALAILTEERTLTLAVDEPAGEVALHWRSVFGVGPGAGAKAVLSGSAYQGLGLRFVRDLDRQAKHFNSENAPYSAEQKWDVIAARWAATQHQIGGRDVLAAIFASPKNAGTSRFFSMIDAFAYLSATQSLDQTPLEYKPGDTFVLDYLVLACTEHRPSAQLEARYEQWSKELETLGGRPATTRAGR